MNKILGAINDLKDKLLGHYIDGMHIRSRNFINSRPVDLLNYVSNGSIGSSIVKEVLEYWAYKEMIEKHMLIIENMLPQEEVNKEVAEKTEVDPSKLKESIEHLFSTKKDRNKRI